MSLWFSSSRPCTLGTPAASVFSEGRRRQSCGADSRLSRAAYNSRKKLEKPKIKNESNDHVVDETL